MKEHWRKFFMVAILFGIQISIFFLFLRRNVTSKWMIVLLAGLQLFYFIVLFGLTFMILKEKNMRMEQYIVAKKQKIQRENQYVVKDIQENVCQLKQNIQADTDALNDAWNVDEIKEKIDEALEKYKWAYETKICENKVVDAILLNKLTLAKEKNIPMYIQAILPVELKMDDLDIVSLFSNLIDNAMEANESLPRESRFISVTSGVFANVLYVAVENQKEKGKRIHFGSGHTSKEDVLYHGYGTKIIRRIVERYEGHIQVVDLEDRVKVQLYMYM